MTTPDIGLTLALEARFPLVSYLESPEWLAVQRIATLHRATDELEVWVAEYQVLWGKSSRSEIQPLISSLLNLAAEWRKLSEI